MTLVEKVTRVLDAMPSVRLAILFGSTARGTATARSDIDLGVSLVPGADLSPILQVELERAAGREVSVTWLDTAAPLLRLEIARDGMVLVEREPHAWVWFRTRAMIDWWDWAPTAKLMHRTMHERLREEASRGPA